MELQELLKNLNREVFWDTVAFDVIGSNVSGRYLTNTVMGGHLVDVIPFNIKLNDKFLSFRVIDDGFTACLRHVDGVIYSNEGENIYDFMHRLNGIITNGLV